jgi:hypothetical protein
MRTLLLASVADSPVACLYCFGLGRLASPVTRHQAALLLLLKENSKLAFLFITVPSFRLRHFSYAYQDGTGYRFQHGFAFYSGAKPFLPGKN